MDIAEEIRKRLEEEIKARGRVNVLIAGRSGVGKSTLINAIFQGNMAETGQGRPVTQATREITKEGIPVAIWDTRGLEMAAYKETIAELERLIRERAKDQDPSRHIHVAWLCIQEDGRRVEDAEIALHDMLAEYVPVIGVVTKARSDQGFRAEVQRLLPEAKNVVRVRALPEVFDDGHTIAPSGLSELVELTSEVLPGGMRKAFVAAQKASIDHKKKIAHRVVAGSATAAAAAGASPIPFSDAAILVPIQIGMLAGITAAFGLELSKGFLSTLVAAAAGGMGATAGGRAIVSNLLKFIPGVGTVAGAAISATTAAVLTTTLGELYIATLTVVFTKSGGEVPDPEDVAREFKERLSQSAAG
jgi:uncharacterized protein (DUF697 family)/predicted GTPase